jgi:hypothetical protein
MSTYIYILGKDRDLSLAELCARYHDPEFKTIGSDFAIFDLKQKIGQSELDKLGGVIKIGCVVSSVPREKLPGELLNRLMGHDSGGKLNYGVSIYGWDVKNLRGLLLEIKKGLKKENISSRFANQNFENLSTAQHKGLGKKGVEMIITKDGDNFFVAEVVAVQNIDSYSRRDYEKPYRDMKVGMLPPKLAQIMVNLTGVEGEIWDPFCGGGVLIMEGLLMGHNMMGSDIDSKILSGAERNVKWIKGEFDINKKADLFIHDATRPFNGKTFDAIATEGYLGPPQAFVRRLEQLAPIIRELDRLYLDFFKAIKNIGFRGPIVIALPFFRCAGNQMADLSDTVLKIQKMGYILRSLVPFEKGDRYKVAYSRDDQVVGRMIYLFELI